MIKDNKNSDSFEVNDSKEFLDSGGNDSMDITEKNLPTSSELGAESQTNGEEESKTQSGSKQGLLQFLKFVMFSIGAGIIEFLTFFLLGLISKNLSWLVAAEIISVVLSCIFNFTLNRKYTFKNSNNIMVGMVLYGLFYLISTPLWAWGMKEVLQEIGVKYDLIVKGTKMLLNFVLDFLYCKFIIFGLANRVDWNKKFANFSQKYKKRK